MEKYTVTDINEIINNLENNYNFDHNLRELNDFINWYELNRENQYLIIGDLRMYSLEYLKFKYKEFSEKYSDDYLELEETSTYSDNYSELEETSTYSDNYSEDSNSVSIPPESYNYEFITPSRCFWYAVAGGIVGVFLGDILLGHYKRL